MKALLLVQDWKLISSSLHPRISCSKSKLRFTFTNWMLNTLNSQLRTSISRGVQAVKTASYRVKSLLCIFSTHNTGFNHSWLPPAIRTLPATKMWARLRAPRTTKSSRQIFKGKLWSLTSMKRSRSWNGPTMTTSHRTNITNREKMSCGTSNKPKTRVVLHLLNLQVKGREEWF